jgi:hypothetical protein
VATELSANIPVRRPPSFKRKKIKLSQNLDYLLVGPDLE